MIVPFSFIVSMLIDIWGNSQFSMNLDMVIWLILWKALNGIYKNYTVLWALSSIAYRKCHKILTCSFFPLRLYLYLQLNCDRKHLNPNYLPLSSLHHRDPIASRCQPIRGQNWVSSANERPAFHVTLWLHSCRNIYHAHSNNFQPLYVTSMHKFTHFINCFIQ